VQNVKCEGKVPTGGNFPLFREQVRKTNLVRFVVPLTLCACALGLMLLPSSNVIVHDASLWLGGTEITDAVGHSGLFCFLAMGWYWALRRFRPVGASIALAFGFSIAIGTFTEAAQSLLPSRGMSLLDFAANWFGVALFIAPIRLVWLVFVRREVSE